MKFKVGDLVEVVSVDARGAISPHIIKYIGHRGQIVGITANTFDHPAYKVEGVADLPFARICFTERQLKKIMPPEELGSWEAIQSLTNWNPSKIEVSQ